jgi:DNA-binding response OmpR family regulator
MGRILVAAPDAALRAELAKAFRIAGNTVEEAPDAATCLRTLEAKGFQALVLHPALPGLEESRLLHNIRRNPELAAMKVSLLASGMTPALWEFLGRQFFDLVVEEEGVQAAGTLAAGVTDGALSRPKTAGEAGGVERRKRILVVEDEPTYCLLLGTEFQALGWATVGATSAEAGLELLGNGDVDAVLSDIDLPGMMGNELAERLRQDYPELKVILMTGMPKDRYPKVPAGIPILPKPISVRELMKAMRFLKNG